jgi:predicted nucleic acid-binding protein
VIVLDTSGLLAAIDSSQHRHEEAAGVLRASADPLLLSPFVLAELDYLITTRVSGTAARALLDQVAAGVYRLEPMDANDVMAAADVIDRYADLHLGLTDASLVILADRYGTSDVLTLDERHFRALLGPGGRPFRILPSDK